MKEVCYFLITGTPNVRNRITGNLRMVGIFTDLQSAYRHYEFVREHNSESMPVLLGYTIQHGLMHQLSPVGTAATSIRDVLCPPIHVSDLVNFLWENGLATAIQALIPDNAVVHAYEPTSKE